MNRTKIEWAKNPDNTPGYTWNPITGCLNGCEYCYARKLANTRLRERYLANSNLAPTQSEPPIKMHKASEFIDPFYPRFWEDRLDELGVATGILELDGKPLPKGIFVCDMSDLFGIGIPEKWTHKVLYAIWRSNPNNRYYLLTKQPLNLIKFSPFPDNCFVGQTLTGKEPDFYKRIEYLQHMEAKVKFISFEPLLATTGYPERLPSRFLFDGIHWVIIGACTGTMKELLPLHHKTNLAMIKYGNKWTLQPQIEYVREIVEAADKAGIPVFLKQNLKPLLPPEVPTFFSLRETICHPDGESEYEPVLRQDMPLTHKKNGELE